MMATGKIQDCRPNLMANEGIDTEVFGVEIEAEMFVKAQMESLDERRMNRDKHAVDRLDLSIHRRGGSEANHV